MIDRRINRIIISFVLTIILMVLLVMVTPSENPPRLLVMLGGTMPEGMIQGFTYLLFFFGILEVIHTNQVITNEYDSFHAHLLPEKENWVLSPDDVNQLKLNMQQMEHSNRFLLTDLIKKACTKYRLSKSSSETLGLVESQVRIYNAEMESGNHLSATPHGRYLLSGLLEQFWVLRHRWDMPMRQGLQRASTK